jgi:CSLREA domain-containing protein
MSQRAIRRAGQRRLAAEQRRESLRRRRATLATGAAIGATALFAPSAQADTFEVNSLADGAPDACTPDCTLRDAITLANANSEADTITFQNGLSGTIRLTAGQLTLSSAEAVTIEGPGVATISVSGDADDSNTPSAGDSRILYVTGTGPVTISGLTLTEGNSSRGGAVYARANSNITLTDSAVTNNLSSDWGGGIGSTGIVKITSTDLTGNMASSEGGAVSLEDTGGARPSLEVSGGTISGNSAGSGGGIGAVGLGSATVDGTDITGNTATIKGGGLHAGVPITVTDATITDNDAPSGAGVRLEDRMALAGSTISGNDATGDGGGISAAAKYAGFDLSDSEISGNTAAKGGGLYVDSKAVSGKYEDSTRTISDTTISGNEATLSGAGIYVGNLYDVYGGDTFTISETTISGNHGGAGSIGGGLAFGDTVRGTFDMTSSTISGNTADTGAGVSFGSPAQRQIATSSDSIEIESSTIAANAATTRGGGIYLGQYDSTGTPTVKTSATIPLTSTLVGDNTAGGSPDDLDRVDTSTGGGFNLSFSLVEAPGDAPLTPAPDATNVTGVDPQLGALADNGGPTETQLPADQSPAVDHGDAPSRIPTDQRGEKRTRDGAAPNPDGGDGTDIGSVEIPAVGTPVEPDPPPPEPSPPGPGPTPPNPPPPTTEDLAPRALIKRNMLRASKDSRRLVSGVATDDNRVRKVEVSIVSKRGGMCRELRKSGRFSGPHRCGRPRTFLLAQGTSKWRFKLASRLAPGYYVVYARATDDKGHRQKVYDTKSRRPFRVR